ncbi:MAG: hypothetical protein ACRD32_06125 [Nitrososphaerales archaeon]
MKEDYMTAIILVYGLVAVLSGSLGCTTTIHVKVIPADPDKPVTIIPLQEKTVPSICSPARGEDQDYDLIARGHALDSMDRSCI